MEIRIAERRERLTEDAELLVQELFAGRIRKLEKAYQKDEMRDEVKKSFGKLFGLWKGENGRQAVYLGIGFLYSSILMGKIELCLTLYGEEFYLDREAVEIIWEPPLFTACMEEDQPILLEGLLEKYPRLCASEKDAVRFLSAEYYHAALFKLCLDWKEEILAGEDFEKISADQFTMFFGHHRGDGEILFRCEKEGV